MRRVAGSPLPPAAGAQLALGFGQRQFDIAVIHRATGVYTAVPETEALLDRLGWLVQGDRLLDPGAGNGGFLVAALRRVDLARDDVAEAARRVRGYEFYPAAVSDARRAVCGHLLARGWSPQAAGQAAEAIVEERDYLLDPVPAGAWDLIAANPPYWRLANLPDAYRIDYEAAVAPYARPDMLYAYLARSADIIAPGGRIGLITADRWLLNSGAAELRRRLGSRYRVSDLLRLDPESAFYLPKDRRRGTPPRVHPVSLILTTDDGRPLDARPFRLAEVPQVDGIPLPEIAEIRLAPWLGPDGIFLVDASAQLPAEHLVPAVEPQDIDGDVIGPPRRWALVTTETEPPAAILAHLDARLYRMPSRGRRLIRWLPPETFTGRLPLPHEAVLVPRIAPAMARRAAPRPGSCAPLPRPRCHRPVGLAAQGPPDARMRAGQPVRPQPGRRRTSAGTASRTSGGQVTSRPAYGPQVTPGDVVSYCGAWMAVTEAGHNGILGLTRLAMIDAAGDLTCHTMLASDVIGQRTDARIDPDTLYKLADRSAAARYISTAPGATADAVDDQQLAAWIEEKHSTSLNEGTITGLHDVRRLAHVAVQVLDEHRATHPIRDIAVWTLDDDTGEALITVDHPVGIRQASFTLRPQSLRGHSYREALTELLAIARALTARLDALVASTAHLWTHATADAPPQAGPADRTADAKRVLSGRLLAAIPPGQRDQAEEWLTDLLYLAEGSLSRDGQEELIREALGEAGPEPDAERDYEVAGMTRTVRACSPQEAVALALREAAQEADDPHHEPDPNPRFYVRPAHSRGPWQLVYEHEAPVLPAAADEDGPLAETQGR